MSDNTIIQQGSFTADGADKIISVRSDADWLRVYNLTNIAAATQWAGVEWYWQRGMNDNDAIVWYHAAASQAVSTTTCANGYNAVVMRGISTIDTTYKTPGAAVATTAGTNATQPVYATGTTGKLNQRSIVRINSTAHTNLNGLDFTIDTLTYDTSFRLANAISQAPGLIAGAGYYRFIAPNREVYDMFYPKSRVIANISQAASAVVTTLVDHGYAIGDSVKFNIPTGCGMVELDGETGTITAITNGTFTVNINTAAYTAFTFPLAAAVGKQFAQVSPNVPGSSNVGFIGLWLGTSNASAGGGTAIALGSPAGTANDNIIWIAGKSV